MPDQRGKVHSLVDFRGRIVVVNFWSAECPWSERADLHLTALASHFSGKLAILPIASNLNESSILVILALLQRGLEFVLFDDACRLANTWGAQTTPHAFVIDPSGFLRYQGAVDNATFRNRNPDRFYVNEAVDAVLVGHLPEVQETQPYGCTIVRAI